MNKSFYISTTIATAALLTAWLHPGPTKLSPADMRAEVPTWSDDLKTCSDKCTPQQGKKCYEQCTDTTDAAHDIPLSPTKTKDLGL